MPPLNLVTLSFFSPILQFRYTDSWEAEENRESSPRTPQTESHPVSTRIVSVGHRRCLVMLNYHSHNGKLCRPFLTWDKSSYKDTSLLFTESSCLKVATVIPCLPFRVCRASLISHMWRVQRQDMSIFIFYPPQAPCIVAGHKFGLSFLFYFI